MNRKDLQMILDFDPMQVAEENAEKRDEAYVLGLILNYLKGNLVKKEMIERGDTYHGMPLIDFRKIMINNGFKLIYEEEFEHKSDAMYKDIQMIYWNDEGLLIDVDSYWNQKIVNSGNLYYNWTSDFLNVNEVINLGITSSGYFVQNDPPIWCGNYDVREALMYHIENLKTYGSFLCPWVKTPYLWLLHYVDDKGKDYSDLEEIRKKKLGKIDKDIVNKIITKESRYFVGGNADEKEKIT